MKQEPEAHIDVYINEILMSASILNAIGVKTEDVNIVDALIIGLLQEWENIAGSLMTKTDLKADDVVGTLRDEEARRMAGGNGPGLEEAMFAKVEAKEVGYFARTGKRNFPHSQASQGGKGRQCWTCGNENHIAQDCSKKFNANQTSHEQANFVNESLSDCVLKMKRFTGVEE
ncbi:hypothetical protein BT69DRAFT_1334356 [Atractiella rhizophila]|nr:hypothetical protein BT69DRAFT_1334356 [Atractiella rhizophila]